MNSWAEFICSILIGTSILVIDGENPSCLFGYICISLNCHWPALITNIGTPLPSLSGSKCACILSNLDPEPPSIVPICFPNDLSLIKYVGDSKPLGAVGLNADPDMYISILGFLIFAVTALEFGNDLASNSI